MAKRKGTQDKSVVTAPEDAVTTAPRVGENDAPAPSSALGATAEAQVDALPELPPADAAKTGIADAGAPQSDALMAEKLQPEGASPSEPLTRGTAMPEMANADNPSVAAPRVGPEDAAACGPAVSSRSNRFALLAASVALAAALGALAGALGASGLLRTGSSSAVAATAAVDDTAALQAAVGKLRSDVTALRKSIETANHAAGGHFSKMAQRLDRLERGQAQHVAKLAKAVDAMEHAAKHTDAAPVTTGSIKRPVPTPVAAPGPRSSIPGWVVRRVRYGVALLEGRGLGLVEVERGDVLPALGRIEAFKKQNGRWVVVTSKGTVASAR